jgi:hypothetical protein
LAQVVPWSSNPSISATTLSRHFGNDVAFRLLVEPEQKAGVLSGLLTESQDEESQMNPDAQLLHLMQQNFRSYFEVKEWLEGQGITFRSELDPRA